MQSQASPRFVEVNLDGIVRHWDHPEHVVGVDVNVVVVDLFGDVGRSGRTGVEVKSNKGESALMMATVGADELTLTEAHVRPEGERHGAAGHGVCSGPAPADVRQTHKPVEGCNLRREDATGWAGCGNQRGEEVKNAKRRQWLRCRRTRFVC